MADPLSEVERRALGLAADALSTALAGDWEGAVTVVQRIGDECGSGGVERALLGWCDAMLTARGITAGARHVRLVFFDADSGRVNADAEQVPVLARWAGRLPAAHAADDRPAWNALLDAIPNDARVVGDHVKAVLEMAFHSVRHTTGGVR